MRRRSLFLFLPLLSVLAACTGKPQAEPFSFIVVDDLHFARAADYPADSSLDARTRRTIAQSEAFFRPLLDSLRTRALNYTPRPVAILSCGDAVHGGLADPAAQFRRFFAAWDSASLPIPLYNAVGNHESACPGMEQAYDSAFIPFMARESGGRVKARHFSLDFGNSHFVFLDCQPPGRHGGDHDARILELLDEQWRWLEADLQANRDKEHIFVFAHPTIWPVNGGDVWYVYDPQKEREFVDLLARFNVRAYFGGHEHVNSLVACTFEEGKELVQMVPDTEVRLGDTTSAAPLTDYTAGNVAGKGSPWSQGDQALVEFYRDRVRCFRKTPGPAGYFIVTVEGPRVTVRRYEALTGRLTGQYALGRDPSTGRTTFECGQP